MTDALPAGEQEKITLGEYPAYSKLKRNPKRPSDYDSTFPTPVSGGAKAVGWIESELDAWLIAQINKSRKA